jgi:hypothetical protein
MKKHHWHAFWHEKLFEKHPQPHCQTRSILLKVMSSQVRLYTIPKFNFMFFIAYKSFLFIRKNIFF